MASIFQISVKPRSGAARYWQKCPDQIGTICINTDIQSNLSYPIPLGRHPKFMTVWVYLRAKTNFYLQGGVVFNQTHEDWGAIEEEKVHECEFAGPCSVPSHSSGLELAAGNYSWKCMVRYIWLLELGGWMAGLAQSWIQTPKNTRMILSEIQLHHGPGLGERA
ncbi:hypothetical protein B0H17DRAFT_1134295 [Mycena rosella]|uniref:Uncharacterized protein n=1 Tax=Mycena rosella TaxID=1033263 RepID=A0AAD7GJ63_MYCRO|nr:hypothetical protein B0H17DRAFT_1134295 [Mycena rosella]